MVVEVGVLLSLVLYLRDRCNPKPYNHDIERELLFCGLINL